MKSYSAADLQNVHGHELNFSPGLSWSWRVLQQQDKWRSEVRGIDRKLKKWKEDRWERRAKGGRRQREERLVESDGRSSRSIVTTDEKNGRGPKVSAAEIWWGFLCFSGRREQRGISEWNRVRWETHLHTQDEDHEEDFSVKFSSIWKNQILSDLHKICHTWHQIKSSTTIKVSLNLDLRKKLPSLFL